ncbi:MAG: hypothetical protein ACPGVG_05615, partial [Mycobacterium sp.]
MSIRPTESGGRIAYAQTPWGDYCVVWDADGNLVSQVVAIKEPGGTEPSRGLGDTIAKIAAEKGGIIKQNCPVVSAAQDEMAEQT